MDEIREIERRLWLEGAEAFERHMAVECIMAFAPMGVMRNATIVGSLREAPRWTGVTFSDEAFARPAETVAVFAYRAAAQRNSADYTALCTSTYVRADGEWRIAQHQQTAA